MENIFACEIHGKQPESAHYNSEYECVGLKAVPKISDNTNVRICSAGLSEEELKYCCGVPVLCGEF